MSPRVGVGFTRIGNDLDADRRRGVAAFGFGLEGFPDGGGVTWVASLRIPRDARNVGHAPSALRNWRLVKPSFICWRAKAATGI
jgi:hypothetical protein